MNLIETAACQPMTCVRVTTDKTMLHAVDSEMWQQ